MMPRGMPKDLDDESTERIVRSFLVVRIVRGSLLLVFLVIALVGVEANDWPSWAAVVVVVGILAQAAALAANCRRYVASERVHSPARNGH